MSLRRLGLSGTPWHAISKLNAVKCWRCFRPADTFVDYWRRRSKVSRAYCGECAKNFGITDPEDLSMTLFPWEELPHLDLWVSGQISSNAGGKVVMTVSNSSHFSSGQRIVLNSALLPKPLS